MGFRAHVQYDDWEGTAAADNASATDLDKLLRDQGSIGDNEFLVGVELWVGENNDGKIRPPIIQALILDGDNFDNVAEHLKTESDPVKVRKVDLELSLEEFVGLFKRFAVSFTRKGLELTDREYEASGE